jgi:hypothetical protein
MPARVIEKPTPLALPDIEFSSGDIEAINFQDCMNIIQAYERAAHTSATESSVFAPLAHTVQSNRSWAQSNKEVLSARLLDPTLVSTDLQTRSSSTGTLQRLRGKNLDDALKVLKDDCIPCDTRIKLSIENALSEANINTYLDDVKARIKMLSHLDKLLGDVDVYRDICALLEALNFMCVPDLQRLVSILMALMLKVNLGLGDMFSLIVSLILPMIMPLLSGVVNILDQFTLLVTSPIDCILDSLLLQMSKLNVGGLTQPEIDLLKAGKGKLDNKQAQAAISTGLQEIYAALIEGRDYVSSKLSFYEEALKKAITDWTGDSTNYIVLAQQKLRTVQLINLVISLIQLKRKGGRLCKEGNKPTTRELDNFFNNYLNPNSCIKLVMDPAGTIRVEECEPTVYQVEDPGERAKILNYEPEDLLTKPLAAEFKCSFHTTTDDVEKVNRWIQELNKAG